MRLGAMFIMLISLLSMLAWLIKTDQRFNYQVVEVFQDKFLIEMTSKQSERTKQIKQYCAKYGKDSSEKDLDLSNFIVLEKYKLVYCSVPKVACTVWKRILANLEGFNITNGVHKKTKDKLKFLSNYTTKDQRKILKTYKKFMFVREPFQRLLSAYRDCFWGKFKRRQNYWTDYRKAIRDVLAKRSGLNIDVNTDNTTFEQFATYLVLRWREGGLFQEHWREQHKLCHPCHIQFDYVGHYETLVDDALFMLRKTKLEEKVFFPEWRPTNTSALVKNYYSTLSLLRIRQLWNIYKEDFELFGYTYPGSVQMVVDNLIKEKL
ncbi:hypothetical protein ACROYT_G019117 [Oculina patagonica]